MQAASEEVRALAEQCVALLQSAAPPLDEEALRDALARVVALLESKTEEEGSAGAQRGSGSSTSPRSIVRVRDAPARKAGTVQSKSVALPSLSSRSSASSPSAAAAASQTPPSSPPSTKQRSGSVWSAAPSPQGSRKSASATPTLGRHKAHDSISSPIVAVAIPGPDTPPSTPKPEQPPPSTPKSEQSEREGLAKLESARLVLTKTKELEQKAREGQQCSSCRVRTVFQPCTECWEGQCTDVACAGLYTLKSLGETAKRLICKRCIENLRQKALASRSFTHDGKARPPTTAEAQAQQSPAAAAGGEADNPMYLAAQMRRKGGGGGGGGDDGEATNPMFNAGRRRGAAAEEETAVDQDDPFDDFSWTGVSDEDDDDD